MALKNLWPRARASDNDLLEATNDHRKHEYSLHYSTCLVMLPGIVRVITFKYVENFLSLDRSILYTNDTSTSGILKKPSLNAYPYFL